MATPSYRPSHCPSQGSCFPSWTQSALSKTDLFRHSSILLFLLNINKVVLGIVCLLVFIYYGYFKHIEKHRKLWQIDTHCSELSFDIFASGFLKWIKCYINHCRPHSPLSSASEVTTMWIDSCQTSHWKVCKWRKIENLTFWIDLQMENTISLLFSFIFSWLLIKLNTFHAYWLLGLLLWIAYSYLCLVVCPFLIVL